MPSRKKLTLNHPKYHYRKSFFSLNYPIDASIASIATDNDPVFKTAELQC